MSHDAVRASPVAFCLRPGELERSAEEIRGHEQRLAASHAEREELGALKRYERARLDERIARQKEVLRRARASYDQLADETVGWALAAADDQCSHNSTVSPAGTTARTSTIPAAANASAREALSSA